MRRLLHKKPLRHCRGSYYRKLSDRVCFGQTGDDPWRNGEYQCGNVHPHDHMDHHRKPVVWTMAFVPGYGLRAAGDVKFSMITSCCTMWACRFCLCVFLIRVLGFGPMGVWIGMFADWTVRGIIFTWRFHSRKWLEHKVI